jgi:hypothetical protein
MKPMMGMMNMMAECERMMQMTDRYQSVPNQQWRNNPQQPERQ